MLNPRLRLMPDSPSPTDTDSVGTEEYFRLLFEQGPAACIVTDADGVVIGANRAAETLLLWSLSEMLDKPFRGMIATSDVQMFDKIAADILVASFGSSRPLCLKPRTGPETDVLFKASVIRGEDRTPQFISWVLLESLSSGPRDFL